MLNLERLSDSIAWIDLSFVERDRTPRWAIQVGIRCHLGGMSLRDASQFLEELGVQRSHVAIHNWVQKAELQPISTVSSDQLAVDEKVIRINGTDYWLYGAVDRETNKIIHFRLFPATTKQTTRWFLADLHRHCQLDDVEFLVDDANYLVTVLSEDGYRFQVMSHGNRNAIERVFWEIERRTSSFATSYNHVNPKTAESWLQALAVRHNSRQRSSVDWRNQEF
jgi:putative transposase